VNYQAQDLAAATQALQEKLQGLTQDDVANLTTIPNFDDFSQNSYSLLPDNFITTDSSGSKALINPTNFQQQLNYGIGQLNASVTEQATGLINAAAGKTLGNFPSANAVGQLAQTSQDLFQTANTFSTQASNQMAGIFSGVTQGAQFGSIQQALQGSLDKALQLTPKNIRDLRDPQALASKISNTVASAQQNIASTATQMANAEALNAAFNNSGQGALQQLGSPAFSGGNSQGFDLPVRLTAYWSEGPGTDFWTALGMSSTGRILAEGISAAVDPCIIPYLSRIIIPNLGTRLAVDTGGAVKARKASGGGRPIVDVYFRTREAAKRFTNTFPQETIVKVYPPSSPYKYVKYAPPTYGAA